jgi:hypothetical protein
LFVWSYVGLRSGTPGVAADTTVATSAVTPAATPAPPPVDYRRLSFRLTAGMSEQDVINLLGQARQSALTTCGQDVGKPWSCKMWVYGFGSGILGNGLLVNFRQDDSTGAWGVNGWQ